MNELEIPPDVYDVKPGNYNLLIEMPKTGETNCLACYTGLRQFGLMPEGIREGTRYKLLVSPRKFAGATCLRRADDGIIVDGVYSSIALQYQMAAMLRRNRPVWMKLERCER